MSKKPNIDFATTFKALTGCDPFPWQQSLYERFASDRPDNIPASCNLPTGLGKTSVIAIWLIALATHPKKMPRRLVYVVNRRTVVDQTTDEVEKYRANLALAGLHAALLGFCSIKLKEQDSPLALSTLRGQFADNREWSADPSRPAVICGTVDMIGSRLLFSGYGIGFKAKPLHAGFLGQDSLLVHDEAHLEPAFQDLLITIEKEQHEGERTGILPWPKMRVMELTATSRGEGEAFPNDAERKDNERDATVKKRINAVKAVHLHKCKDDKKLAEEIVGLALKHKDSGQAVLVFARKVDDVEKIVAKLKSSRQQVQQLTGTLRGLERDRMADPRKASGCPIFARFLRTPRSDAMENERWNIVPATGTVYLVCTSAGEVGVNITADHLVCDLSTFESMAQRFGRVNRFGDQDDTRIDIVYPNEFEKDDYESRLQKTLELLRNLNGDGSPAALGKLDANVRLAAFTPKPIILPATDFLFDAWALTTIREKMPGRPKVEPYLHGICGWEPPETHVAWREEVGLISGDLRRKYDPEDLLEDYPLKPHELLRDNSSRVFDRIKKLNAREETQVWIVADDDSVEVKRLGELIKAGKETLYSKTVLLPPSVGGLDNGMLTGGLLTASDVADEWYENREQTVKRRVRVWNHDPEFEPKTNEMRLIRRIDFPSSEEDESEDELTWYWYELPKDGDSDGSKSGKKAVLWQVHTDDVRRNAQQIVEGLLLSEELKHAIDLAAKWHDLGKRRSLFQRMLGNMKPNVFLAKSGNRKRLVNVAEDFRHEFGSLVDVLDEKQHHLADFLQLTEEMQLVVLHLIAVHHGYGRPHFPIRNAFDPESTRTNMSEVAANVPLRFALLQRKYGRWGLAYLESMLRAADWAASSSPTAFVEGNS